MEPNAAPSGFVDVGALSELSRGTIGEFFVGERAIAIANIDGALYAIDNVCAHAGGPLGDGVLEGCVVVCPWHGWRYDVRNGTCELDPSIVQTPVEVRTQNGRILVHD